VRRETFETLAEWEISLFYLLIPLVLVAFGVGLLRLARKYRRGRGLTRLDHLRSGAARVGREALLHRRIGGSERVVRLSHLGVLWGFVALVIATGILMLNDDITRPLLGIDFWRDGFYVAYSLLSDLFGLLLLIGLLVLAARRLRGQARYDYRRPEGTAGAFDRRLYAVGDWVFLGALLYLVITGFVMEAMRIAVTDPGHEVWSMVGWPLSRLLRAVGMTTVAPDVEAIQHVMWWAHASVALVAVAAIPYTKAMHMLTSPMAIAISDERAGRSMEPLPDDAPDVGYRRLPDFAPGQLLGLDACTRCGLCHVACPAIASGAPLSPRDLILDLREASEGAWGTRAALRVSPMWQADADVVPAVVRSETIWSCTTCLACQEACPVGIQHVPLLAQLRRRDIEVGEIDEGVQRALERVATTGNAFGQPRRSRGGWSRELDQPLLDARDEPVDLLWFVGDHGSFDPRGQATSRALAEVLAAAGERVGILRDGERTAGCDVRRVGEEALWVSLAEANIGAMAGLAFERIVTGDPHTLHTLRSEYVELPAWRELCMARGSAPPVVHHSQLLEELLASGRLRPARSLDVVATYHDPCYLGRYQQVYDSPRAVLRAIGVEVREMPRNRAASFCCGAGGGRIWAMDEARTGAAGRPAEQRLLEALAVPGVTAFVVACPKDASMFTAALATLGVGDRLAVRELSELVAEALQPDADGRAA
jgi:Fe-S oxidoreductase